jgi:hypothetical protein
MPSWPLWLLLAALLVLPVLLRLYAGDDPRNEITDEQSPDDPGQGEGPALTAAA